MLFICHHRWKYHIYQMFGTTTVPKRSISTNVILRKLEAYLSGENTHYTHHLQLLHARCLPATQAAISRSLSTAPLCKVERPCPQMWVVALFPRLGQFPLARASVRRGGARRKRTQSTKQTESGNKTDSRNELKPSTLLTVSTPAKSRVSGWGDR